MNIRDYLDKYKLVFDGAMGTYYASMKENTSLKCELANLNEPKAVLRIHRQYIEAGCSAIKTNTFGANKLSLEGDFNLMEDVIIKGFELAQTAAGSSGCYVFADIGPIPQMQEQNILDEYKEIVDIFLNLGAENFLFETFSASQYLSEIAGYIKEKKPEAFVIASFAVTPEGYTRQGFSGMKLYENLSSDQNIDVVGFNCVSGPFHLLQILKKLDRKKNKISIMPNAGYPSVINNRTFFSSNANYFAGQMAEIAKNGAAILGGCCGTTPEYISETVKALKQLTKEDMIVKDYIPDRLEKHSQSKNSLLEKLQSGKRVIAVELDPPMDTEIGYFMDGARALKTAGVDAITIADCPIARARVDSSILACKLERELGITPLPHMTCRDRNINATKALLLGLNIEGVNNVLVVTGDPIPSAERNEVKSMFSYNSVLLANYIRTLNENTFSTPFHICGALNVNAVNFDAQLKHAEKKVENGMGMLLTQPVLTKQAVKNLKKARENLNVKILGGIIPVVSHRNACFMNSEISGITVSDEIIALYDGATKEKASELAVKISVEIAKEIKAYTDGYYLITPFKRTDYIVSILNELKE